MESQKNIVRLENIHKIYKTGEIEYHILKGINLTVRSGEFISIMGPSGSGKSTLMNIIGLLDRPNAGKVYIDGIDVAKLKDSEIAKIRNRKIGFVFQQFNLIQRLTVYENIELPLLIRDISKEEREKLVREALLRAGGDLGWLKKKPNQLSGGQQQRVAIARALVGKPKLILADEPTGNLDRDSGRIVMETLKELNKAGETIILVTHDIEVGNCAQKIYYIKNGEIVGSGETDQNKCILNSKR
ncbi:MULTISPECIES: ABC transporter ATP-binding protein [Fervidicoccus]|uniref:ABC transporter ATP-binding protein n=1 Tax=Fervidicoccus fontis (strain DSM 19380 / JCM 18336 / VKM B-2539 / Kam940) TaxID=1163730 RepID=I0A038_FERFK|nr:ABC transporter ATP-binding protein [Fervidicoccus fontis]AFH42345.1 ABC transporter ATP-binding protein [Fervidicoccus fontis Kam940]